MRHDDPRDLAAFVLTTVIVLILGALSAIYYGKVVAPAFRGTAFDLLLWPGALALVFGGGWAWLIIFRWLCQRMGTRPD